MHLHGWQYMLHDYYTMSWPCQGATSGDGTCTMPQPLGDRTTPLTVVLVDGQRASRVGLRMVLETEPGVRVVGETSTMAEGLRLAEASRPGVIILDLDLLGADAAPAVRQLVTRSPQSAVLVLALSVDPLTCANLVAAGAARCIEKDFPETFLTALRDLRLRSSSLD
jgi:DNA-binding NarL/FixJ family response regulator